MSMVKCLVCGAVLEAGTEVCPVCGVGREQLVPVEAETGSGHATQLRYVILGGGIAAATAAEAIRDRDAGGEIVLLCGEPVAPYARPMLTKGLAKGFDRARLMVHPAPWYEERRIRVLTGETVEALDVAARRVTCGSGLTLTYDRLIYALGARCFVPPIPGSELSHVTAIRSLADAEKVRAQALQSTHAAVIGGGVLGLEAAWELRRLGLEVTVIEVMPQLMSRQLDDATAQVLARQLAAQGIGLKLGAQIARITPAEVELQSGETIPAQMVIVSAGVRANTALAQAAGLTCGRGVTVDAGMRTSDPAVFACGDCAELDGVNLALWSEAMGQGRTAGANAAGDSRVYQGANAPMTLSALGLSLVAMGDCGKGEGVYEVVERPGADELHGCRYWFRAGRLCGAILLGEMGKLRTVSRLLDSGATVSDLP